MSKFTLACLLVSAAILPPPLVAETAPTPSKKDIFTVHSYYNLFIAPADFPVAEQVKDFEDLTKLLVAQKIVGWGDGKPTEAKESNWSPVGFTGVTSYSKIPGTDDSITHGLELRLTYKDRTKSTVVADVTIDDTRGTTNGHENLVQTIVTLKKDTFQVVKVGPPQADGQTWIALKVDDFSQKSEMLPVQSITLPPGNKMDLKFTAADGQEIDTAKMRGKVILLDYWATWCGPCVAATPRLADLYKQYHDRGLEILGINLDSERGPMDSFLRKHPHPWPNSVSAGAGKNPLFDGLKAQGIPVFILIDKNGIATPIDARNPDTGDRIEAMLKA